MLVQKINSLSPYRYYSRKDKPETTTTQPIQFHAKPTEAVTELENLIVPNIFAYELGDTKQYSKKLLASLKNIQITKLEDWTGKTAEFTQTFIDSNQTKKIATITYKREDSNNFGDLKVGFATGKAGIYGIIKGADFGFIIPPGVTIEADDFSVSNKITDNINFKGSVSVNFYLPEETHRAVAATNNNIISKLSEATKALHDTKLLKYKDKNILVVFLAGGFGQRLEPISKFNENNKPSTPTTVSGFPLFGFSLLQAWQAGLVDNLNDIQHIDQKEAASAVGCVVTEAGYRISKESGYLLVADNKRNIPANTHLLILPSDNISDADLTKFVDHFFEKKDAGMMIVGVPDPRAYGGLILADENDELIGFVSKEDPNYISKNNKEDYINKFLHEKGKAEANQELVQKYGKIKKDGKDDKEMFLGNGFMYMFHPDMMDMVIAKIYKRKIEERFKQVMDENEYSSINEISNKQHIDIIEALWDREIIPTMIAMAKRGELRDTNGEVKRCYVHRDANCDWNDVGQIHSYIATMQNLAKDGTYAGFPKEVKQLFQKSGVMHQENLIGLGMDTSTWDDVRTKLPNLKVTKDENADPNACAVVVKIDQIAKSEE